MKLNVLPILFLSLSASKLLAAPSAAILVPQIDHVIIVEFENTDYKKAMAQPTFARIAKEGANLTNFYAENHPSQANYIAMIAGETFGVRGDANVTLDGRHIGDLIEESGKSWKVYADDYPGDCFLGAKSGQYARKHVPFLSFKNVQSNPDRCARIVKGTDLKMDLESGALPDYSLYIPNQSNDGHDTGVAYADNWLKKTFMPLIDSTLPPNTLVVFTFDESTLFGGNHIYTTFYGDMVEPSSVFATKINHYGLLHTIEEALGLETLGKLDASSPVVTGIWK